MSANVYGADLDGLNQLSGQFAAKSESIRSLVVVIGSGVTEIVGYWHGADSAEFAGQWANRHRPALLGAADGLAAMAELIERNRADQEATSALEGAGIGGPGPGPGNWPGGVLGAGGVGGVGAGGGGAWSGVPGGPGGPGGGFLTDFLFGDVVNLWNGGADGGFPTGQLGAAALRMLRTGIWLGTGMGMANFPTFNTGLVGRGTAWGLQQVPMLSRFGTWLGTPGATAAFTKIGIAGGIVGTGLGVANLVEQGWPWDAYEAEGAGYVADVASTAFSASTTAFFLAPNPVTGALVIGTGLVWAGAELVDNWDEVSEWAGDAWDTTTGWIGDAGSAVVGATGDVLGAGADLVGDVAGGAWDAGSDLVGGAWDAGGDLVGGIVGGISDWF